MPTDARKRVRRRKTTIAAIICAMAADVPFNVIWKQFRWRRPFTYQEVVAAVETALRTRT